MGLDQLFRVSHREGRLDVGILPAATQGHAHADHGIEAVTQGVGQAQLGAEQLAFGIQHGQVVGVTVVVLQAGDLRGAAQAVHLGLAGRHDGVGLALGGQGGAHVLEGVLHRLAVHGDGRFLLGLGVLDVIPGAAEVQQRHGAGHAVAPGARRTAEQVHHAGAEGAQHARQGNGREELGTGHADIGVVGHDHVLGSAHVGTALQQLGRQAGRQHGRGRQLADVTAARHDGAHDVTGRAAQQHGQAGFGAVHGHRGAVHLGTGRFHFGAGTLPVQLRDVALTVAAFAVTLYKIITAKSAEEIAYEKVNAAIDAYNQKLDEQKNKAEQLHATMQDEVSTAYTKRKAYEELIRLYPELLQRYSEEEIKLLSLIDLTKELNDINDTRKENNLQEQYDAALEKVKRLDQAIADAMKFGDRTAMAGLSLSYKNAEAELDEYRKQLYELKETQKAAEWDAAPAEVKIATLQGNIDELKAQNAEIDRLIENARNKQKEAPYLLPLYGESEDYYQSLKQSNLSQIATKQNEISSLRSDRKETNRNKSYWEGQKKEAEAALEAMDVSLKGTAKWNELIAKIAEYDSKIKQYSVSGKTVTDAAKAQKKLSDLILANDKALQQSRIDILKDGKQKELAEIDLRTKEEMNKLEQDKSKLKAAQGGIITADQTKDFQERQSNIQQKNADDRAAIELKYAQELDKIYKQITDDTLSEEDRRIKGIKDKYEEFRKWVEDALKAGNITKEQATDLGIKIDQAEIAASLNTIVEKYGTMEDKIAKIREKHAKDRETATKNGRSDLIPQIDKHETEEIGQIKVDELMKTDDWINLFQNLDALSSREILRIIDNINRLLQDADLDPINLKTVTDQLDQAADIATRKNPFASISANFKAYKKALADGDDLRAVKLREDAWQAVAEAIDIVAASISGVSSIASALGADEDTTASINNIAGAVGGAAQAVSGFASGNIVQGIQGTVSAITSLINLFSGDRRKERNIQRLQDQIDALEKSYDELGEAVEEAYSTDASELIEQQNELLEQQKILIQNQIAEERSKKDTDEERIKEWENQIDEINKQIEENKEKALDAIFGEDLKSAIDNFATAYADAWANGEDRARTARDVVRNMMRQMVIESIKSAIQSSEAMKKIREKLQEFWLDGVFSAEEQEEAYKMADDLQKYLDDKYGWAGSLLSDNQASTQNATSRGFQAMSQDTSDELNGRFTDMQGKMNILVNGMELLRSINMDTRNVTFDIRDIMIQLNGNVADIRTYTRILPAMGETLVAINRKLDNL